jgi:hypothetical protein
MPEGRFLTECPISTADGVKAADVAWASPKCLKELGEKVCFPCAPEICVAVLSPSNTEAEIQEKAELYFDAGANEVWLCAAGWRDELSGADSAAVLEAVPAVPKTGSVPLTWNLCARRGKPSTSPAFSRSGVKLMRSS